LSRAIASTVSFSLGHKGKGSFIHAIAIETLFFRWAIFGHSQSQLRDLVETIVLLRTFSGIFGHLGVKMSGDCFKRDIWAIALRRARNSRTNFAVVTGHGDA
jgi:hypothetical protein